jgi:hypothetical protein
MIPVMLQQEVVTGYLMLFEESDGFISGRNFKKRGLYHIYIDMIELINTVNLGYNGSFFIPRLFPYALSG